MNEKFTDSRIRAMTDRNEPAGNDILTRLVGGSPLGILVRLVLLSIVVGFILNAFHISPEQIFDSLRELVQMVWRMGLEPLHWLWRWFILGAAVVLPIWLIMRLMRGLSGK
jgi:hypothetical protein